MFSTIHHIIIINNITIPYIQQQNNGHECGLFAIANMMEFVASRYSGLKEGILQFEFIQSEMRHYVKCFHQKYMEPFPKKKLKTLKVIKIVSIDIDLFCFCSVPDAKGLGSWISCDVCDQWYLQKCEGINGKKIPRRKLYTCKKCQA